MKRVVCGIGLAVGVLLTAAVGAQTTARADRPAPSLGAMDLLQAPAGAKADLSSLRGKVVVVEFWATWCASCVRQIPHFNALADEMKDDPVQFISITDEDRKTVEPFLAAHPMRGWVGLSLPDGAFAAYGIEGRPQTIVIRPDGVIDVRLIPSFEKTLPIRAQNLRNLLAGKPSGLVTPRVVWAGRVTDSEGNAIPDVVVRARKRTSKTAWVQFGNEIRTDRDGRFRIDRQYPASYVNELPAWLEFVHPAYLYGRLEDLRLLPAAQLADLQVTLRDGNVVTGRAFEQGGRPVPDAKVRIVFDDLDEYEKDAATDSAGRFELRGLPPLKGELRALAPGPAGRLLSGHAPIDLSLAHAATVQMHPAPPPGAKVTRMLGMTVVDGSAELQKQLFLREPGLVVLDPGTRKWLDAGDLRVGDCLCARRGQTLVNSARSLAALLLEAQAQAKPNEHAWLSGTLQSFEGGFINGGPRFALSLTADDIAELHRLAEGR